MARVAPKTLKTLFCTPPSQATGGRVAVLVGLGTDMELYRHRARVALRERLGLTPGAELTEEQVA